MCRADDQKQGLEGKMRAIWKGHLKIGLVTIPVKMISATTKKRSIQFHLIHLECGSRLSQRLYCKVCQKEVKDEEVVRGYEFEKDRYVIVKDEDLEKLRKESTGMIEVFRFVAEREIDPIYYSDCYYLLPDGKIAIEAFSLFLRAMEEKKVGALAKTVMRNREHLLCLTPLNGTFVVYGLRFYEEIERPENLEGLQEVSRIPIDTKALSLAKMLIENMAGPFVPSEFKDEYTEQVERMIMAKLKGEELESVRQKERAKVLDLLQALQKSIEEREIPQKGIVTAGKRQRERRKRKVEDG
jgi:DNA end-binding protein Ku